MRKSTIMGDLYKKYISPIFTKSESGKQLYADCLIFNGQGKLLLLHRQYGDMFEAGKWCFAGGHVDEGESVDVGCIREVKEETGIILQSVNPLYVKEVSGGTIHYFQSFVFGLDDNAIILDPNEHRGYIWVDPKDLGNYDLVCDLASYLNQLQLPAINIVEPLNKYSDISSLDGSWELIKAAFDKGQVSEEQFFAAKKKYTIAKSNEQLSVIKKAFDNDMISEERYFEALQKAKSIDPSHGGKLIKKTVVQADGTITHKWVSKDEIAADSKKAHKAPATKVSGEQWWSKFKEHNLNCYPIGIDEKDVKVNTEGDINSHAVMTWKDPKTGATKSAYTKEFMDRNAAVKWERVQSISKEQVESIRSKSISKFESSDFNAAEKDAAAIIAIIAHTGLRRGEKGKFSITGNRGVSTLSADNIEVKGDTVKFSFIGKSYQHNTAEIKNKKIAKYLKELKQTRKDKEFLFDTNDNVIDKVYDEVGGEGLKLKDMRTYVANEVAHQVLFEDPSSPPPVPQDISITQQKKLVQDKLKRCFEVVAEKLNNTPTMAKNSYIHPNVIDSWIRNLGVSFEVKKSEQSTIGESININEEDEENCDLFNLPDWWDESL